MKTTGLAILFVAIFALLILAFTPKAEAQHFTYSTGIVAPGYQAHYGPTVTIRRPVVNYRYIPQSSFRASVTTGYGPVYAPTTPSYNSSYHRNYNNSYSRPYNAPTVNVWVH